MRDVDERVRREVAQLGLVGLEQEEGRRGDGLERAGHAGAGGEAARPVDRGVGDRVVGVERIGIGVGDQHVGRELADLVRDQLEAVAVDVQRVVAEVEALEAGAERGGGSFGLAVPDPLDVLDRLPLLLPQLAGLAAFPVGEGDDSRFATVLRGHGARPAGPPHEVGRVRPDHHHLPRAHLVSTPATMRVFTTAITYTSSSLKPASSSRSTISAIPSSTGGLNT